MEKIIFVDVDGPLINTPCYFVDTMASIERKVFNTQSLGYLIELARVAAAKIVTNSTHNNFEVHRGEVDFTLKDDMVRWGVPEEFFHSDWRTTYPYPPESKFSSSSAQRRLYAISLWQEKNGNVDWIAFDDDIFTTDPRLIPIDFLKGIDYDAYHKARSFWNITTKEKIIL